MAGGDQRWVLLMASFNDAEGAERVVDMVSETPSGEGGETG